MRYYNIDMRGKFKVPRVSAHPSDEKGRIYVLTTNDNLYYSDGSDHYEIVLADGGTYNINVSGSAGTATYS